MALQRVDALLEYIDSNQNSFSFKQNSLRFVECLLDLYIDGAYNGTLNFTFLKQMNPDLVHEYYCNKFKNYDPDDTKCNDISNCQYVQILTEYRDQITDDNTGYKWDNSKTQSSNFKQLIEYRDPTPDNTIYEWDDSETVLSAFKHCQRHHDNQQFNFQELYNRIIDDYFVPSADEDFVRIWKNMADPDSTFCIFAKNEFDAVILVSGAYSIRYSYYPPFRHSYYPPFRHSYYPPFR
eukprot:180420_1